MLGALEHVAGAGIYGSSVQQDGFDKQAVKK